MKYTLIILVFILFSCKKDEIKETVDPCRDIPYPEIGVEYSFKEVTYLKGGTTVRVKYTFNTTCSTAVYYEYFRSECEEWQYRTLDQQTNACK